MIRIIPRWVQDKHSYKFPLATTMIPMTIAKCFWIQSRFTSTRVWFIVLLFIPFGNCWRLGTSMNIHIGKIAWRCRDYVNCLLPCADSIHEWIEIHGNNQLPRVDFISKLIFIYKNSCLAHVRYLTNDNCCQNRFFGWNVEWLPILSRKLGDGMAKKSLSPMDVIIEMNHVRSSEYF